MYTCIYIYKPADAPAPLYLSKLRFFWYRRICCQREGERSQSPLPLGLSLHTEKGQPSGGPGFILRIDSLG